MFEKILLPVDGSEPAMRALRVGADVAGRYGAEVAVVCRLPPPRAARGFAVDGAPVRTGVTRQGAERIRQQRGARGRRVSLRRSGSRTRSTIRQGAVRGAHDRALRARTTAST